ncbi:MAG: phospholipase D-like domain-containing protein [Chloroflexota bacterium]|nr:phospholipase D-like domain-containing protein [Chloroflexota bacterium]
MNSSSGTQPVITPALDPEWAVPREPGLTRALRRVSGAQLRPGNTLTLLQNGPDTFDDWLAAISRAQRWVHLENYIFKADQIGRRFADALSERAAAGVPVRVLYDWYGSWDVPSRFWQQLRHNGVDVRVVNPLGVGAPLHAISRDHRKFVAVDGEYASVGGVCIADPWLQRSPVTGLPYRDTAVGVTGPVVADLERAFAAIWATSGPPLPPDEVPDIAQMRLTGSTAARVMAEEPGRQQMLRMLQVLLAGVENRVWIADAYFLILPILREALIAAARDGIDVRILLPATNDLPIVGALSRWGYRPLLEVGIRIWEYAGLMMHAKTTIADGWWSRVGSTNLNVTGLITNWEINLVAEDTTFGAAMEAMYLQDLSDAREIRLGGPRRYTPPLPVRPETRLERRARKEAQHGSGFSSAGVGRLSAALGAAGSSTLEHQERLVGAAIGGTLVATSLLTARFPRLLAWPLAAVGAAAGGTTLIRALRPSVPGAQKPARTQALRSGWRRSGRRRGNAGRRANLLKGRRRIGRYSEPA